MDYEPYGDLIENARSGNPAGLRHTYTGQEDDSETGLMYYGARYYDPVAGMFPSADVLTRLPDEPQTFLRPELFVMSRTDPQGFNRYAYCGNNPMVYIDDTGEFIFAAILVGVFIGAMIGGTIAAAQSSESFGSGEWWADVGIGAGIGAAAGLVGGLGAAAAAGLGATAAVAGGIGGFAGGFTSGVLSGFQAAGWQASGWKQALTMGAIEGTIGAITGGLLGGYGGAKLGGAITKRIGAAEAAQKLAGMSRFQVMSKGLSSAALESQFARQWGGVIEEMAGEVLGVAFDTALAHPVSLLNGVIRL